MSAGLFLLTRLPDHGSYLTDILPAFIVTSLGAGMVFLPMTNAAVSGPTQMTPAWPPRC